MRNKLANNIEELFEDFSNCKSNYQKRLDELSKVFQEKNGELLLLEIDCSFGKDIAYYWGVGKIQTYGQGVSISHRSMVRNSDSGPINILTFPTEKHFLFDSEHIHMSSPYSEATLFLANDTKGYLLERLTDYGEIKKSKSKRLDIILGSYNVEEHFINNRKEYISFLLNSCGMNNVELSDKIKSEFLKDFYKLDYIFAGKHSLVGKEHEAKYLKQMKLDKGDYSIQPEPGITVHGPTWINEKMKK